MFYRDFGNRVKRPRHVTPFQINRMAKALIEDMMSGAMPVYKPTDFKKYPIFEGENEEFDHRGFVEWLWSKDFLDTLNLFHETSIMDGIERIG